MNFAEILGKELTLSNGIKIKNRFMKSAMSEVLGSKDYAPTKSHERLYHTWANGGTGLLVTGNVMVDSRHIGEPGNVVIEDEQHIALLESWAAAGTANDTHLWMQINHPGKQTPNILTKQPLAPSAIPLKLPMFNKPRALTEEEILEIIQRFGRTAEIAKRAKFTGVQIHGAHGYLVNQFLSPHHNQRQDKWGGSLENRMRFLLEVYQCIRNTVGKDFPVALKVNSADFQKGGFTEEESLQVIKQISDMGMDLVEISGGTYEAPAMTGQNQKESTQKREAYFLKFAQEVRKVSQVPLAVTGGFRTAEGMAEAIDSGEIDFVGVARALAIHPDMPKRILDGENFVSGLPQKLTTGIPAVDLVSMLSITWYEHQLAFMGKGKAPKPRLGAWTSVLKTILGMSWKNLKRRRAK